MSANGVVPSVEMVDIIKSEMNTCLFAAFCFGDVDFLAFFFVSLFENDELDEFSLFVLSKTHTN